LAGDSASVQEISAVAAIGLNARDTVNENLDTLLMLERVKLPLLDLMGSEDNAFVKDTANERQEAAKRAGNTRYEQKVILGANHFHVGREADLLQTVDVWLVSASGAHGG
jgi:alpha/beta superfamily hydrolase